ncbi:ATP-binding protein [Lichenicoccus roseus]|uniref:ATP-binding protein n=1 Tax=Lichenicoccus roseus TaxID=2683649 RepID=A0A5R9J0L9_9PROT|nr:ATP-binding protein [Lichenicoccus roseus]TLU71230.1 ATP-binding protein [Lichenicoccus roseus]
MRFVILRLLTHSELGMFHEYRRQGKEGSKQRAINFDWDVVDRVFPAANDSDRIDMDLLFDTDDGVKQARQWLKRQEKNWRLEGNCPRDKCYHFIAPGCLFAMEVDASTSPASGSWSVFSAEHIVTRSILSDGESSRLAKSAMIALHDEEGERTWQILAESRPDIFTAPRSASLAAPAPVGIRVNRVELPPNPARLVQILAAVGHTLPSAVADIVDNSISHNATRIAISFGRPDGGHGRWMSITDDGDGMDGGRLAEAMRIGSASVYEANSLGKYGYGLKGASWSQAKVFTVVTKQEGGAAHHLTWDVDDMHDWVAKSDPLEQWEEDATVLGRHGTVVLWKDMRPPQSIQTTRGLDPYSVEVRDLDRHLALVFHRFLEGKAAGRKAVAITINGKSVEPNNPFGHPYTEHYDAKPIRVSTETEDGRVTVQAYLLPSEDEIEECHKAAGPEAARKALDRIGLHGKRNETQGLFIYRHDRLIKWGGWHQMWETNDEKTKLARLVVNFDNILDDVFKINISKQIVQLPQALQAEIKKLAEIARKDSQKKYRRQILKIPAPQQPQQPGTGANPANVVASVRGEGLPVKGGVVANPLPPSSRVSVKDVRTDKFLWKLTKGLTGALDLQVSDANFNLAALVKHIRSDQVAVAHLAAFLGALDEANVQIALLQGKAS